MIQITEHFALKEFTYSSTALRRKFDNNIYESSYVDNIQKLCILYLEPLREAIEKPIKITSGYRCPQLNRVVGGSKNSQHLTGSAVDFQVEGFSTERLITFIIKCRQAGLLKQPWGQLINEYDSWVHISLPAIGVKGQILKIDGKTRIVQGYID